MPKVCTMDRNLGPCTRTRRAFRSDTRRISRGQNRGGSTGSSSGKPQPDAFVCLEAIACPEVADVLNRNEVTGKTVVAMDTEPDTLQWIKKGFISATIAQKPFTMAFLGLKMLDDLYHHKPQNLAQNWAQELDSPVPAFVDTGTVLVDQSNVDQFLQPAAAQ